MRTVTYKLEDLKTKVIHIGKVAENEATRVQIDAGSVFAEYPAAVPAMSMTNPEGTAFPVSVERSGDMVLWDVKDSALAAEGQGEIQFTFTEGNTVAKSVIGRVQICRSIVGDGEAPDPIQDWMTEADAALEEIENISATAETLSAGSQATASYADGVLSFGIPQGAQGAPGQDGQDGADGQNGVSPTVAVTTITGGHTVTITDAQGDHAFNVMDGTAGAVIDDTSTAADKVWSASKTNELKSALTSISETVDDVTEVHISKNLYDKTTCNPVDGKSYWEGDLITSANYATTGKIPVEAETQYVFNAGSVNVRYCEFYSGETGGTFISKTTLNNAPFTTPENCTFVALMLFNASHTTEEYEKAIAIAQLNKGATVQQYEPYGQWPVVTFDAVEDGEKLKGISSATTIQPHINLYDKALAMDGKFQYQEQINAVEKNATTGLIPVKPNTQYCFSKGTSAPMSIVVKVWEYNSERTYIGYLQTELGQYNQSYSISFKTSANTRFIAINLEQNSHTTQNYKDTIDSLMLTYGTHRPLEYSAYSEETVVLAEKISNSFFANPDCFAGKRWLALGTSVTWYDAKKYQSGQHIDEVCRGYVGNVARRKPLVVNNNGIAGSTLGNYDTNSLINRYQSISWTDYDIVTLEFGINDYGNDIPVGTASDAAGNTTFAACLKTVIEYAMAQNKKLNIVVCTEPDVRGDAQNNNNNTLKDYADVTLAIAAIYRLPVCDWYYHSGINNYTRGNTSYDYLTVDGTHPNNDGHMRMGAMLNQVFDSLLC